MKRDSSKSQTIFAAVALLLLPTSHGLGQQPPEQTPAQSPAQTPAPIPAPVPAPIPAKAPIKTPTKTPATTPTPAPSTAAADIADFFSQVGNRIYEHCIFELSQEQLEVQQALIEAYIKQGATSAHARQLAIKQIQPPELSDECKQIKDQAKLPPAASVATPWLVTTRKTEVSFPKASAKEFAPSVPLADKQVLPQWDCAPGVNYVTIQHRGYERKLTDGEICSPFEDIVHNVPETLKGFRLGYTISTGRLFVVASDPQLNGKTIAWAISGREACRNNPDPDCLATRAIGSLPPGEYSFTSDKENRVSWGPKTRRMVAGIFLTRLWNKEKFTSAQTAAMLARGNIAIHVRLKGEMSEACLALEPNGWAYVSSLISDGRATGVNVYLDEPHPKLAEQPPVVRASSFSLSALFKQ
jgi:hypothetical protein